MKWIESEMLTRKKIYDLFLKVAKKIRTVSSSREADTGSAVRDSSTH